MNKKLAIVGLLVATTFVGLPSGVSASSAVKETSLTSGSAQVFVVQQRGRRYPRRGYWRNGRYYRNYGQFRRTQVGWRRYRMVPRYYWRDGRRYTTYRRVYYYYR